MKRTVLIFGLIGGLMMAAMMFGTLPFLEKIGFAKGLIVGYTTMIIAFMMVFFGIRSYRENVGHGQITFGRAFAVGILIALLVCAFYVVAWEIIYFKFMPDFAEKYSSYAIEQAKAAGESPQAIAAKVQEMKDLKAMLDNPFLNAVMTLIEPLPVGIIVTLISALILRKKVSTNQESHAEPVQVQ